MKNKREYLLATALSVLAVQTNMPSTDAAYAQAPPKKGEKPVNCYGINEGAGTNGCAISQTQISAINKLYKNKFNKAKEFECAGNIDGSASKGYLGWVSVKSEEECLTGKRANGPKQASGFIIKPESNKTKIIIKDLQGEHVLVTNKKGEFELVKKM